jgi:hypothetical protein
MSSPSKSKNKYAKDAEDDDAFLRSSAVQAPVVEDKQPDPYEVLRKRNEILNQFKERNKTFARDPYQIPVNVKPSDKEVPQFPSAQETLEQAFT